MKSTTSASFEAAYEAFEKQQNGILLNAVFGSTPASGVNVTDIIAKSDADAAAALAAYAKGGGLSSLLDVSA